MKIGIFIRVCRDADVFVDFFFILLVLIVLPSLNLHKILLDLTLIFVLKKKKQNGSRRRSRYGIVDFVFV